MIIKGRITTIEDEVYYIKKFFRDNPSVLNDSRFTITSDELGYLVNVDGDVAMNKLSLTDMYIRFGEVKGSFGCSNNKLTSLLGAPHSVGGKFNCMYNELTNLNHAPKYWETEFVCSNNSGLVSFEGLSSMPNIENVTIWCTGNKHTVKASTIQHLIDLGFSFPNINIFLNGSKVKYPVLERIWTIKQIVK